ncbi:MAG: LD-carboxypeptidase [Flavipsychrobacter sp.]|nr:LD-carboxypeptidase [Flavipsychrobacter sp.]
MIIPPYLQQGSTVGITCPSGYVSKERVSHAITVLESWGLQVVVGQTVGTEHFYFSGNDDARLDDLQCMLDNPGIDAIIMGRGGYGMSRIIDRADFTKFQSKPKWVTGFSDITVLHNHIHAQFGVATLHSPMCGAFTPDTENSEHLLNFKAALTGEALSYAMAPSSFNRDGSAEAIVTGGNLAILAHLTGSASEADTDGKILFIEDIGEHLYNIDRLLLNLKRAGKLENIAALLVGSFTDNQDTERPFGQTVEEIIWDKVKEYDYPVCYNFPCGHQEINYTLSLGQKHRLSVDNKGGNLELLR